MAKLRILGLLLVTSFILSCADPLTEYDYNESKFGAWPLASGVWTEDVLDSYQAKWYSLSVTAGTSYDFNMNRYNYGDGTKTAYASADIYNSTKTTAYASSISDAYSNPTVFVAAASETIYIKITGSYNNGTFAIRLQPSPPPVALIAGTWQNETILSDQIKWYSFAVTAGTSYDFNMNNYYYGDNTMTAHNFADIYHGDKTTTYESSIYDAYNLPLVFVATASETIYIKITDTYNGGSFAIRMQPTPAPTTLVAGTWLNETIVSYQTKWYSFAVTAGTSYDFNMNNGYIGNNTAYTYATIYHADKTATYASSIVYAYGTPTIFVATANETIYIKIFGSYNSGTFAIRVQPSPPPTALESGVYIDDSLLAGETKWYSFDAIGGTTYRIYWNDSSQGNGKTCNVEVSAYHANKVASFFTNADYGYTTIRNIVPSITETIFIKVVGYYSSSAGTFAIKYQ